MLTSSRKRASIIIKKKAGTKKKPVAINNKQQPSIASRRHREKKHTDHQQSTSTPNQKSIIIRKKPNILITPAPRKTLIRCPRPLSESDSDQSQKSGNSCRSQRLNAECFKIIKKLDPKGTLTKEQLIYELETLRHKLQGKLEVTDGMKVDPAISRFYNNVVVILCDVKAKDIGKKVEINETEKNKIIASFKKKFKKMEQNKFSRVVDLTAPKSERKPEIGVQIWKNSKDVVFNDNTYRKPTNARARKFKKFNVQKSMDESLVDNLNNKLLHNLNKYDIVKNHSEKLNYQKYNPFTYTGVKWC